MAMSISETMRMQALEERIVILEQRLATLDQPQFPGGIAGQPQIGQRRPGRPRKTPEAPAA